MKHPNNGAIREVTDYKGIEHNFSLFSRHLRTHFCESIYFLTSVFTHFFIIVFKFLYLIVYSKQSFIYFHCRHPFPDNQYHSEKEKNYHGQLSDYYFETKLKSPLGHFMSRSTFYQLIYSSYKESYYLCNLLYQYQAKNENSS